MAEHESYILLRKVAKTAFDELAYGRDKNLPTVKTLQAEYATLLEEKSLRRVLENLCNHERTTDGQIQCRPYFEHGGRTET